MRLCEIIIAESAIFELQKHELNLDLIEQQFGIIKLGSSSEHHASTQSLLQYLHENNLSPNIYAHIVNEKCERLCDNTVTENISSDDATLQYVFDTFSNCEHANRVAIGDEMRLLQLEAWDFGSAKTITLSGFKTPDLVTNIDSNYIVFNTHGIYPISKITQLRMWKQIQLYDTTEQIEKCIIALTLLSGKIDDWELSIDTIL